MLVTDNFEEQLVSSSALEVFDGGYCRCHANSVVEHVSVVDASGYLHFSSP